jgi:TPR repeat protein
MLQYGIGGPKLPKEAASWYARGGSGGNVSASKNGALAYALGWGVRRDTRRAKQLLASVPADQRGRKMLEIARAMMQPGREEPEQAL